jgi:opacity protein-like surface antigen
VLIALQEEDFMKKVALLTALLFALATVAAAQMMSQDKSKRPSPPASAECKFADGKTVKIDYSSPRAKGRKIFGAASDKALVPFGEVWRTGANEATTFVTGANVTVGGKDVPAGIYTIFTVPKADAWTLVISKKTGEWGTDYPGEKEDLARASMAVAKTSSPVENFTIAFDQLGKKCTLRMEWENTQTSVEIAEK